MYEFYYFNSHWRIILSRFWRAIMRNKRKNVVLNNHYWQLPLIQRYRSRSWGWFPSDGQQRPRGRMQGPQSERPHSLWLRLNVKLLLVLMDFPWEDMTISNRAKQRDPQGHGMPVSGSKEHTELDKSELATRLTTATGLHTPAYRGSRCKERARSLPVSVFALCRFIACQHLLSAVFSYRSFVGSAFCKSVSLTLFSSIQKLPTVCQILGKYKWTKIELTFCPLSSLSSIILFFCFFVVISGSLSKEKVNVFCQSTKFLRSPMGRLRV